MEAYLVARDKFEVLVTRLPNRVLTGTDEEKASRELERENFKKVDRWVKSIILLSLDANTIRNVQSCASSKDIWDRLLLMYEQRSQANKLILKKEFYDLKMKANESVRDFVGRAESIHGQLKDVGVVIDEQTLTGRIVCGLPRRFMNFMSKWSDVDPREQTVIQLLPKLLTEEALINQFGESSSVEEGAMVASTSGHGGAGKKKKRRSPKEIAELKKKTKCNGCGEVGHWKAECPLKADESSSKDEKDKGLPHDESNLMEAMPM